MPRISQPSAPRNSLHVEPRSPWESRSATFVISCTAPMTASSRRLPWSPASQEAHWRPSRCSCFGWPTCWPTVCRWVLGTTSAYVRTNGYARRSSSRSRSVSIRHGLATFLAFVTAGAVPLVPYIFSGIAADRFVWSTVLSLAVFFAVGAARARVGSGSWWTNGLEMLGLGVLVGAVAYGSGVVLSTVLQ